MIRLHFPILRHRHSEHRRLLESLDRKLHWNALEFRCRLNLIRIQHLNLNCLLSVARFFAGYCDRQYKCLHLWQICRLILWRLRLEITVDGSKKLYVAIGARHQTDHLFYPERKCERKLIPCLGLVGAKELTWPFEVAKFWANLAVVNWCSDELAGNPVNCVVNGEKFIFWNCKTNAKKLVITGKLAFGEKS